MKDEIKEILGYLAFLEDIDTQKKVKQVADYITTLQKENKHLNLQLDQALKDYDELQEENEKLKQSLESRLKYSDELDKKIEAIDKALYWLSENTHYTSLKTNMLVQDENTNFLELKDILQGDDNNAKD